MSDVLLYLVRLADKCNVNLAEAVVKKIEKNAAKYPRDLVKVIPIYRLPSAYNQEVCVWPQGMTLKLNWERMLQGSSAKYTAYSNKAVGGAQVGLAGGIKVKGKM
jgi:hypothetical protein